MNIVTYLTNYILIIYIQYPYLSLPAFDILHTLFITDFDYTKYSHTQNL